MQSTRCTSWILLISILCVLSSTSTIAQSSLNIKFNNINIEDGLPNNTVKAIIKDNLGFLWIGTNDGLCRYESPNHIKIYRSGDSTLFNTLESSFIRSLFFDSKNNLWIGTRQGGLTRYNQETENWTTFRHDSNDPHSISDDEILTITEDNQGRIWVGTENGLNIFQPDKENFVSFTMDKTQVGALRSKAVLSIIEDHQGWMWIGTWAGGLYLFIPSKSGKIQDGKLRNFVPNSTAEALNVWDILQDSQNRYWLGTRGAGVFLMTLPSNANNYSISNSWQPSFHSYAYQKNETSIANNHIENIFEDSKGILWVATINGLNRLFPKESNTITQNNIPDFYFQTFTFDYGDNTSLLQNNVISIFEDNQGIIWFGTYSGISKYNKYANQFNVYEFFEDVSNTPNAQNLFIDKEGTAWIGNGDRGLMKYTFNHNEKPKSIQTKSLKGNYISSLYCDDDRHLYLGSKKGILRLDIKTNKLKTYQLPSELEKKFNSFFIRSIIKDHQNRIWIGTDQGLYVLLEDSGTYIPILHDMDISNSISDNVINTVFLDSRQNIWVATYNGLNKLIGSEGNQFSFEQFKHDPTNLELSIPSNRIISIEESNNTLYLGSGNGLYGYDLEEKTFTNFSKSDNKYSIQSIEKTKEGNLWASTQQGIFFFDTKAKQFNTYEKKDGLGDFVFLTGSSYADKKGQLFFGSRRGVTSFKPSDLQKNEIPPPVYITEIRKMGPDGEKRNNSVFIDELELEHDEYFLSLEFAALNYDRSEKNKYAFKLEGLEEKWNYTEKLSPAVYTNLNPGTYTFRVKASNNDGLWNEQGTSLRIIKKPAFWQTWWFIFGSILFSLICIWVVVKAYIKNIKAHNTVLQKYNRDLNQEITRRELIEKELQEREEGLKLSNAELQRSNKDLEQFAYIASHDLQEPLRVVGSFISLLRRRYKQHFDEQAFEYIDFAVNGVQRMSKQIQSILTFSKVGKKEITFKLVKLNTVIQQNLRDLSNNIEEKNALINIDPLPSIYCEKYQIEMVFQNLIGNAIKFNNRNQPIINICQHKNAKDGYWMFSVQDNGIGIDKEYTSKIFDIFSRLHSRKEYAGTGIGLALCQKIVHRHQGEIWVESVLDVGTTFFFTISKNLKVFSPTNKEEVYSKAIEEAPSLKRPKIMTEP